MDSLTHPPEPDLLKDIMTAATDLFSRMREAEQELQDQLISGQIVAAGEAENLHHQLIAEAAALEERRRAILPAGMSLRRYILTRVNRFSQSECLEMLAQMEAELQKLIALHSVNRTFLKERIRYARELQELCDSGKKLYDRKGQLKGGLDKDRFNLDHSC